MIKPAGAATNGFRGFTVSLVVAQPADADAYIAAAVDAGAISLKPAKKGLWGYGGVVKAPDGTIWKVATSSKKDTGPGRQEFDDLVLLLGVDDVKATKELYADKGLAIDKSYGSKYVQFAGSPGAVTLGLYKRAALAKDAGVGAEGSGSHRLTILSDLEPFTDPDGFVWERR